MSKPQSSKVRLVITAVTLANRGVAEVCADYGVSRSWVYELLARYRTEGDAAFEPSHDDRRPHQRRPRRTWSAWCC
jgi:transposase